MISHAFQITLQKSHKHYLRQQQARNFLLKTVSSIASSPLLQYPEKKLFWFKSFLKNKGGGGRATIFRFVNP